MPSEQGLPTKTLFFFTSYVRFSSRVCDEMQPTYVRLSETWGVLMKSKIKNTMCVRGDWRHVLIRMAWDTCVVDGLPPLRGRMKIRHVVVFFFWFKLRRCSLSMNKWFLAWPKVFDSFVMAKPSHRKDATVDILSETIAKSVPWLVYTMLVVSLWVEGHEWNE